MVPDLEVFWCSDSIQCLQQRHQNARLRASPALCQPRVPPLNHPELKKRICQILQATGLAHTIRVYLLPTVLILLPVYQYCCWENCLEGGWYSSILYSYYLMPSVFSIWLILNFRGHFTATEVTNGWSWLYFTTSLCLGRFKLRGVGWYSWWLWRFNLQISGHECHRIPILFYFYIGSVLLGLSAELFAGVYCWLIIRARKKAHKVWRVKIIGSIAKVFWCQEKWTSLVSPLFPDTLKFRPEI
jgi:hypothetical protein